MAPKKRNRKPKEKQDLSEKRTEAIALRKEEKLLDVMLNSLSLRRIFIPKDGACLFRAVAQEVYGNQVNHQRVRNECVEQMGQMREVLEPFVCTEKLSFDDYLEAMKRSDSWGGQVELQALSLLYRVNFMIYDYQSNQPTQVQNDFDRTIRLAYSGRNHYDLIWELSHLKHVELCQGVVYDMIQKMLPSTQQVKSKVKAHKYRNLGMECFKAKRSRQETTDRKVAELLSSKEREANFPTIGKSTEQSSTESSEENKDNPWTSQTNWTKVFSKKKRNPKATTVAMPENLAAALKATFQTPKFGSLACVDEQPEKSDSRANTDPNATEDTESKQKPHPRSLTQDTQSQPQPQRKRRQKQKQKQKQKLQSEPPKSKLPEKPTLLTADSLTTIQFGALPKRAVSMEPSVSLPNWLASFMDTMVNFSKEVAGNEEARDKQQASKTAEGENRDETAEPPVPAVAGLKNSESPNEDEVPESVQRFFQQAAHLDETQYLARTQYVPQPHNPYYTEAAFQQAQFMPAAGYGPSSAAQTSPFQNMQSLSPAAQHAAAHQQYPQTTTTPPPYVPATQIMYPQQDGSYVPVTYHHTAATQHFQQQDHPYYLNAGGQTYMPSYPPTTPPHTHAYQTDIQFFDPPQPEYVNLPLSPVASPVPVSVVPH